MTHGSVRRARKTARVGVVVGTGRDAAVWCSARNFSWTLSRVLPAKYFLLRRPDVVVTHTYAR
jgi:hypothetical protein